MFEAETLISHWITPHLAAHRLTARHIVRMEVKLSVSDARRVAEFELNQDGSDGSLLTGTKLASSRPSIRLTGLVNPASYLWLCKGMSTLSSICTSLSPLLSGPVLI